MVGRVPAPRRIPPGVTRPPRWATGGRLGRLPHVLAATALLASAWPSAAQVPASKPRAPAGTRPEPAATNPPPTAPATAPTGTAVPIDLSEPAEPAFPAVPQAPADMGARRAWLKARLDEIVNHSAFVGAKVAMEVAESETGQVLYAHNEKLQLNAASNVKLITSAAALSRLGPEYRWRTVVYGPTQVGGRWLGPGGELPGDLYLRGAGDPTLDSEALGDLAAAVAAQGLKRIRGGLVVDATFFSGGPQAPAYEQRTDSAAYRSPSSAASLNGNAVVVTVIPAARAGAPARITLEPMSPYFTVAGRIVTAGMSGPAVPLVETDQQGDQTRVIVSGRVRLGSEPRVFFRRVVHPELFLGNTFQQVLKKRGITVDKPMRLGTVPGEGYRTLAAHDSPSLAVVMHELNKRSSNFAAEQVLRTLGAEVVGRPGTWENGLEAVAKYLESLGIARNTYKMSNGAGLYDSNRFTAEQLITVMRTTMRDFRIASEFLSSLSVAGIDGTLGQRMGGTVAHRFVRAKTGTLANVSSLSGVVGAPGQKPLLFSIVVNDVINAVAARAAQDRAAEMLVMYLDPEAPTAAVPTSQGP
jgi:D-alanyl-D-alanine carboxypeptidase/D-alanyl-D-alanine-endopeptidase (penicillin-binding protein 4)